MKMLILITLLLTVTLSGCGRFDRWWAGTTGNAVKSCVDGVTYLQFTSGATVQLNLDGKPVACSK